MRWVLQLQRRWAFWSVMGRRARQWRGIGVRLKMGLRRSIAGSRPCRRTFRRLFFEPVGFEPGLLGPALAVASELVPQDELGTRVLSTRIVAGRRACWRWRRRERRLSEAAGASLERRGAESGCSGADGGAGYYWSRRLYCCRPATPKLSLPCKRCRTGRASAARPGMARSVAGF